MKKIFFSTTIILFASVVFSFAQSIHDNLMENKIFKTIDSKWFVADKENSSNFYEVDQNVITIKFKDKSFVEGNKMMQTNFGAKSVRQAQTGYVDYELAKGVDIFEAIKNLHNQKDVEDIVINTIGKYGEFIPNDQHFNDQWHLNKILMPEVWDFIGGDPCTVVAIIDSGTDWQHEDIGNGSDSYNNLYHNTMEDSWTDPNDPTTGNGVDNDENGFIDDWMGWDFENQDNDSRPNTNSHGTMVAGIVSAKTHNTTGISGVSGGLNNQGIRLMLIKIGESAPIGNVIDDAILYAINNGADVIQMSLGVVQSNAIDAAIQLADNADIPVICASGNNYSSTINYPASNQNVFSVGATDQTDHKCDFSNYGTNLFISAPGKDIYSTTISNSYGDGDGTSFAAPQISGVVALIKRINPSISNDEVRTILGNTADKVGGYTYLNGRCNELGFGRLNAFAAIQSVYPAISGPSLVCTSGSTYTVNNIPSDDSVLWSSSSNLVNISSSGDTAVFQANGSGSGQIWATIVSPECGNTTIALTVTASPGPISIDFDAPPGRFTAMIDGVPTATSYKWYCDGVLNSSTGTIARFNRQTDNCEHVYYVNVIAVVNTTCESSLRHAEVSEPPCNYYSIFPNPATFEISITQNTSKTTSFQSIKKPIKEVRIIDKFGRQAFTQSYGDEVYETKLNISNLQTGSYTIQINQGTDMEAYSVIKE